MTYLELKDDFFCVAELPNDLFCVVNGFVRIGLVTLGIAGLWGLILTPFFDPNTRNTILIIQGVFVLLLVSNHTLLP